MRFSTPGAEHLFEAAKNIQRICNRILVDFQIGLFVRNFTSSIGNAVLGDGAYILLGAYKNWNLADLQKSSDIFS